MRLNPGEVVFRQGDPADNFYLVRVGFVMVAESRPGGEHIITYVGPGGYFGEIGLLAHIPEVRDRAPPASARPPAAPWTTWTWCGCGARTSGPSSTGSPG